MCHTLGWHPSPANVIYVIIEAKGECRKYVFCLGKLYVEVMFILLYDEPFNSYL